MDQRDWENGLFSMEAGGRISDRALLLGIRLSRVITWDTERPGVYWQGPSLWDSARVSKATFYRLRSELVAAGLLVEERGNLFPASPTNETASLTDETDSLADETGSLADETGSLTDETGSLTGETYMHAFALPAAQREPDHQPKPGAIVIGPDTSPAEIAAAFSGPERFASRAAATFVMAASQRWPDAQRPRFSSLARLFEQHRQEFGDVVLWRGMLQWLAESEDSTSMRSPGAVFSKQAREVFEDAARESVPMAQEVAQ